jgi:hypothetical protein
VRSKSTIALVRLLAFRRGLEDRELTELDELDWGAMAMATRTLGELMDELQVQLEVLPWRAVTGARFAEAQTAARWLLAEGPTDPYTAIVAAGWLHPREGFPALARALVETGVQELWELPVIELLTGFLEVGPKRAATVLHHARLPEDARFRELSAEQVADLASALRRRAGAEDKPG